MSDATAGVEVLTKQNEIGMFWLFGASGAVV